MRAPLSLALTLSLLCAACGGSDPKSLTDAGSAALNRGDAKSALESFDQAMKKMGPTDASYWRAATGRCLALAHVDPKLSRSEFLALAKSQPSKVQDQDFSMIAYELVRAHALTDAVDVMYSGIQMYPESPKMLKIKNQVIEESKKANDPEALKALKGLGYI